MRTLLLALVCFAALHASVTHAADSERRTAGRKQLEQSIGKWDVVTRLMSPDGSIMREVNGTYEFSWVLQDRIVVGQSHMPELGMSSGILFYVRESSNEIEMAAVGHDGKLWVMTGAIDGETRMTPEFVAQDGVRSQLRFTRSNVGKDTFESRMEHSRDGGKTWIPGNHQLFTRQDAGRDH